jgi:hypothetical protein
MRTYASGTSGFAGQYIMKKKGQEKSWPPVIWSAEIIFSR